MSEQQQEHDETQDTPPDVARLKDEAIKYRRRLREAEAERDALAERVTTMQRADVERQAAHLVRPESVWAAGVELADLLDDDGNLDPEKTETAINTAADKLGLEHVPRAPRPDPSQGAKGDPPQSDPWTEAFRN